MTERHDPAPNSPSRQELEAPETSGTVSLPRVPHVSRERLWWVLAVFLVGLGVLALLMLAGQHARDWLHTQPEYEIPFEQIQLVPPPPREYLGGTPGLLDQVRTKGKFDRSLRTLDLNLEALSRAFSLHSPWISRVLSLDRSSPGRMIVKVEYRRPVARIELGRDRTLIVANDGALIPADDLERDFIRTLPELTGLGQIPETGPGLFVGDDGQGRIDPKVASAVAMARFLRETNLAADPIVRIDLLRGIEHLMLKTRRGLWVHWGSPPGQESADEPMALDKRSAVERWLELHPQSHPSEGDYLDIDRKGAFLHTRMEKSSIDLPGRSLRWLSS